MGVTSAPAPEPVLAGHIVRGAASARLSIDGRRYVNFYGAGYLALNDVPEIRSAVQRLLEDGTPFSQHVPAAHGGTDPVFEAVEEAGASALGTAAAVYFASGYLIGAVGIASLQGSFDLVLLDANAHFSLRDGVRAHGLSFLTFGHCDPSDLESTLKRHLKPGDRPLIVTDGAFATTGRVPPLAEYAAVLSAYEGHLFVDESHAFGVVGYNGRGAAEYCGVEHLASAGATLSKAYCANGAIVGCSPSTAHRLRRIPPIGAACAGSPLSAAAATASLRYVSARPELRSHLRIKTQYMRERLRSAGLDILESPAPIVSFQYGTYADMQALQRRAFAAEMYLHHSMYVGAGPEGVIRCAVFRDHSEEDVERLIGLL